MNHIKKMIFILLFNFLIALIASFDYEELSSVTFGDKAESLLTGVGIFKVVANYKTDVTQKYLYIYPLTFEKEKHLNEATIKIYFKEISNEQTDVNYLDSDYSTLDFNSGLFIEINKLKNNKANIFFITYSSANVQINYRYADDISFPEQTEHNNLQINQFKLTKGTTKTIQYEVQSLDNEYLTILAKTSLRNIEVTVNYKDRDYTKETIANLYPNGCSIFIDTKERKIFDGKNINYSIIIKNKNIRDEVLLLAYMHHQSDEIFNNKLANGYQMYLESNNNKLFPLSNVEKNRMNQYFTYQTFSKNAQLAFESSINEYYLIEEYNSMLNCKVNTNSEIKFDFTNVPKRNALYIQYIDYNDIEVAQKSLQALVTGSPKSMLIPDKTSMYHFLPRERESNTINYYLRSKTPNDQKMFVSFKTCKNYPEECVFKEKDPNSVNLINNLGLWYSEKTNANELQLIYVYCEKECAYDILMTYDNDPLFMFPENNYTKFIGEEGQDIFILPVFEFLSKNQSINIDLSIISGNAELSLYKSLDKMDQTTQLSNKKDIIGRKQSYTISNDSFTGSGYYKKDIYAVVKGNKNTFYNLMYGAGATNDKTLDNNRVIVESEYVGADKKKTFIFISHSSDFSISISTPKCKSNIIINGKEESKNKNSHLKTMNSKGYYSVQVELLEDLLCLKGQKEEVILFTYNSENTNILLSENTLVNALVGAKEITFRHIFKPNFDQNADNSFSVEYERLSDSKSLKFEYKLEKISFNSSAIKESSNSQFSTYVFGKKANLISNKQIREICGSLDPNEICSITLNFSSSSSNNYSFSLYLNKNGINSPRHLVGDTLINTINQQNARYYYIDVNKEYQTEILINSFGQDLLYNCVVESGDKIESEIIPFKKTDFKSSSNYHKIDVSDYSKCSGTACRIYLGVYAKENSLDKEVPTTFEISYLLKQKNVKKTDVRLPLNYWAQYSFDTINEITYSLESYDTGKLLLELYTIKENKDDNCEVEASSSKDTLSSKEGYKEITITKEELSFTIKQTTKNSKCKFRLRASTVGREDLVVPILPYSAEKCIINKSKMACYYALDVSPENEADFAYFYVPESEDVYLSVLAVEHGLVDNQDKSLKDLLNNLQISEKDKVKRSNWHEEEINKKNVTLIIGVKTHTISEISLTLYSSFYNKPEEVTLNQGEKKIFTLEKSNKNNTISLKIKKSNSAVNIYKINIHAVKGNGLFSLFTENYPLGLDYNHKEDLQIVIDNSDNDIELFAKNQYNEGGLNEFVFSIDYSISTLDQIFNELELARINSYKIIKPGASDLPLISFYMKANSTKDVYSDINMNIKIFSPSKYEIKAYIVDEDFIRAKSSNVNQQVEKSSPGEIIQYIGSEKTDGEFTMSKIEIPSSKLKDFKKQVKKELYVYVTFSKNDKKNSVKIDIYPYDLTNNLPLAQNEIFIHKLPPGTSNYQLLLVKSDNEFKEMFIEYLSPSSNKYKIAISNLNGQKSPIKKNDTNIIDTSSDFLSFGKNKLKIYENNDNNKLRYLLFNVFSEDNNQESNTDLFVFKYKSNIYNDIVKPADQDFSMDNTAGVKFKVDASIPSFSSGQSIFIIKAYKKGDIAGLNIDDNYLSLYLLFSGIKPCFTFYKTLTKDQIKKNLVQEYVVEWNEDGGEYLFTCVNVIVDNERTDYFGYKAFTKEMKSSSSGLLDYMRNHIFATILMFIIALFVCGMICNIIRIDRGKKVVIQAGSKELDSIN